MDSAVRYLAARPMHRQLCGALANCSVRQRTHIWAQCEPKLALHLMNVCVVCGPQNSSAGSADDRLQRSKRSTQGAAYLPRNCNLLDTATTYYVKWIQQLIEGMHMKENNPTVKIGIEDAYEVMETIKKKAKSPDKAESPKKKSSPAQKAGVGGAERN